MPLHGMLLEAKGELQLAKEFYEAELCKPVDPKAANHGSTGETNVVWPSSHALLCVIGLTKDY